MKKPIIFILPSMIVVLTNICFGQSNIANQQQFTDTTKFFLTDNAGCEKRWFASNDTIILNYRITNNLGKDIEWAMGHGGPWVRFLIQQDTSILMDSYKGVYFIQNAPSGKIKIGEIKQTQWTFSLPKNQLPSGNYTAIACPQMLLIGLGPLSNDSLSFKIN
jgi:hypothetical protein